MKKNIINEESITRMIEKCAPGKKDKDEYQSNQNSMHLFTEFELNLISQVGDKTYFNNHVCAGLIMKDIECLKKEKQIKTGVNLL